MFSSRPRPSRRILCVWPWVLRWRHAKTPAWSWGSRPWEPAAGEDRKDSPRRCSFPASLPFNYPPITPRALYSRQMLLRCWLTTIECAFCRRETTKCTRLLSGSHAARGLRIWPRFSSLSHVRRVLFLMLIAFSPEFPRFFSIFWVRCKIFVPPDQQNLSSGPKSQDD